jgi:hypothetical protein
LRAAVGLHAGYRFERAFHSRGEGSFEHELPIQGRHLLHGRAVASAIPNSA